MEPVRDVILGTSIVGTGRTEGRLTFRFVPDTDRALLLAELKGVNYSRSTGYNGPAIIYTTGAAQSESHQATDDRSRWIARTFDHGRRRFVDTRSPALARRAEESSAASWKRRPVARAAQQSGAARAIAQEKANRRLERKFETQIAGELDRAPTRHFAIASSARSFDARFIPTSTSARRRTACTWLACKGTRNNWARQTRRRRLSAIRKSPCGCTSPRSITLPAPPWPGETVGQPELEKAAKDLLGEVPDRLKPEPGKEDWSITFADEEPISFRVADGEIVLVGRGKRYKSGSSTYPAMNFTVRYKIEQLGKGIKAIRQGEIEILPPGFVPGAGKTLSLRHSTLRRLMSKKLEKMFEPEIIRPDPIELKGDWKKAGPLAITHLSAEEGWISVGWNQDRPTANLTPTGAAASEVRAAGPELAGTAR